MAKIVTVTIDENAEVDVDLAGYHGKGCHAIQEVFTRALGGQTITSIKKPEFNAAVKNTVKITR